MRTRNGRNSVPEDGARRRDGATDSLRTWITYLKIFDALRIKVYLAAVIPGEPLEQFRKRTLRAVPAVHKRRNNREPQVSVSSGAQAGLPGALAANCAESARVGKTEQDPQQQPKIGVQQEIFVSLHAAKRGGKKQKERVPENDEPQRKPGRTLQLLDHLPGGDQNRHAHDEPQDQPPDPHFNDERSVTAFDADAQRLHIKNSCDVLPAERRRANAIAIGPAVVVEGSKEVLPPDTSSHDASIRSVGLSGQ